MNRTNLVFAAFALLVIGAAVQATPRPVLPAQWPPAARDMVTINADFTLPPNGLSTAIYTVPADRYLVITEPLIIGNATTNTAIVEDFGGAITIRRQFVDHPSQFLNHSSAAAGIGTVFRPGSQVRLQVYDFMFNSTQRVTLLGYLTPE